MAGLVPAIYVFTSVQGRRRGWPGRAWTSPAMTNSGPSTAISKQRSLPVVFGHHLRRFALLLLRRHRLLGCHLFRRNGEDQLCVVIGGAVDPDRDFVPDETAFARRDQQRHHLLCIVIAAIEPALEITGLDGHGHAVMQYRKIRTRRRGDDRHGIEFLAVGADPGFRQPGEANWLSV